MSAARGQTGFGGAPITYADIVSFERVFRVRLMPWEVATIKALDAAWIADQAAQATAKKGASVSR